MPPFPRVCVTPLVTPEVAAAIVAALARFRADAAVVTATPEAPGAGWLRAARLEAVGLPADDAVTPR